MEEKYKIIWAYTLKEGNALTITLHKQNELIEMVKKFDAVNFITQSSIFLTSSSFKELFLCVPFVWRQISLDDLEKILIELSSKGKNEAIFSILMFIGCFIGIDSCEIFSKIQVENNNVNKWFGEAKLWMFNRFGINLMDKDLIEESKIDIDILEDVKRIWMAQGCTPVLC